MANDSFSKFGEVASKAPLLGSKKSGLIGEELLLELVELGFGKGAEVRAQWKILSAKTPYGKQLQEHNVPVVDLIGDKFLAAFKKRTTNLASALTGQPEFIFEDGDKARDVFSDVEYDGDSLLSVKVKCAVTSRPNRSASGGEPVVEVNYSAVP